MDKLGFTNRKPNDTLRNDKGQFAKGSSGFNGKHTEEAKKKMSKTWFKKGDVSWNKGKPGTMTGKKHTPETIKKMSEAQRRDKNHAWKGGTTKLRVRIWHSYKYRQWRSDIFTRDDFTCQLCDKHGGYLEVDHYPTRFIDIINNNNITTVEEAVKCEELWNINNGRTLCKECHINTETYGNKKKN